MGTNRPQPPAWRVALAFLIAPGGAAVVLATVVNLSAGVFEPRRLIETAALIAVIGAYPPTLILGVPAYFLLRSRLRPTAWVCALAGFLVAATPWLLLSLLSAPDFAASGDRVTAMNGRITFWGYLQRAQFAGLVGAFGGLSGLVFWLIATAGLKPPPTLEPN